MSQELYHTDARRQHPYPVDDDLSDWPDSGPPEAPARPIIIQTVTADGLVEGFTPPPPTPTPPPPPPHTSPRHDRDSESQARRGRASAARRWKNTRHRDSMIRYYLSFMSVRETARALKVGRGIVARVSVRVKDTGGLETYCHEKASTLGDTATKQ